MLVSSIVTIIQLVLVNVFFVLFRSFQVPLPSFLHGIFNPTTIGEANMHWGYVLPFLLSNLLANAYGYFQNKKTTFHANPPKKNFAIYMVVVFGLILLSTYLQGRIVYWISQNANAYYPYAPSIVTLLTGALQFCILFPMEKYYLLKS